ncbi:MAG: SMI1/KNR4 family protein [Chloroflexota bacterium]|nr:SMI1/KNR4 family protein [Chloroflexota bacterium]
MDWKNHIEAAYKASAGFTQFGSLPVFAEPAKIEEIYVIENSLNCQIPMNLRDLLLQTDGVNEKMLIDGKYIASNIFIFSSKEIIEINSWFRKNEDQIRPKKSFDEVLFFGQTGVDGICFALPTSNVEGDKVGGVYAWYPIDCKFINIAETLEELTFNWPSGKLAV